MKPCDYCDAKFRDQYNLERHIQLKHPDMDVSDEESEEEEEMDASVEEKGGRPRDIFDGPGEESDDDSEPSESEESEDEKTMQPETDEMIEKAFREFDDDNEAVMENLVEQGWKEQDAKQEAYRQLLPKYRKRFRSNLIEVLLRINQLRKEPIYKLVMDTAKDLRDDGLGYRESIRAAISKRKHKINEYIPDALEDDGDEDHEEDSQ